MREKTNGDLAIELSGVSRWFGSTAALQDMELVVPRGVVYGLLGPNGSGKTTALRIIMGILAPDQGRVRLFGGAPSRAARNRIGYLPEERGLYRKMRVMDQLVFLGRLRGMDAGEAREQVRSWLDRLGLAHRARSPVGELSKGMQQKVQFIGTLLHQPDLLILDEPFSGLDPLNQELLEEMIREFSGKGVTILLSTHLMDQAERLCQHVSLVSGSRKVLDGPLARLRRVDGPPVVDVQFQGSHGWLEDPRIQVEERRPGEVRIQMESEEVAMLILAEALEEGVRISRFRVVEPTLRDLFLRHTREAAPPIANADGTGSEGREGSEASP